MNHRYIVNVSHPIAESRTGRILSAFDRIEKDEVALKFVFVPNLESNGLSHPQLRETAVWALLTAAAKLKRFVRFSLTLSANFPRSSSIFLSIG